MGWKKARACILGIVIGAGLLLAGAGTETFAQVKKKEPQELVPDQWIDQSRMTAYAESYQAGNEAEKSIDGNVSTIWHTSWSQREELPQSITLALEEPADGICQLRYTPRKDKDWNGTILEYKISVSTDGETFYDVAAGIWEPTKEEKTASFDARDQIKAVRLTGITTKGNTQEQDSLYVSAAEIQMVQNPSFRKSRQELEQVLEGGRKIVEENPQAKQTVLKELLEQGQEALEDDLATQEKYEQIINEIRGIIAEKTSVSGYEGSRMYDTKGELIQAHGGQITKWGDTYYWYGEDKTDGIKPVGVHLYTSADLYNWEDQGIVMKTMKEIGEMDTDPYFAELYGALNQEERQEVFSHMDYNTSVVERPKVLYNAKTKKYVMWFHADGPYKGTGGAQSYGKAMAGVAIADKPEGPFRCLGASRLHASEDYTGSGGMARDMNLFADEDGTGYIIYASEDNASLHISRLNEEYTDLAVRENAVEGVDFTRNLINQWREAPAMFQYRDKYYLMTSGCTGWDPNAATYYMSDSPMGPWKSMGSPCVGEESDLTFRTQSTCIFPVDAQNGKFIYMGDRWNRGNLADSRYVWLPVEFEYDYAMKLLGISNWTLKDLEGKSGYTISEEDIPVNKLLISEELNLKDFQSREGNLICQDGSRIPVHMEWKLEKGIHSYAIGFDTLRCRVSGEKNLETEVGVNWYQGNTVYFVDCNGTDSDYFSGFAKKEIELLNKRADQKFDGTWGLLGTPGKYNGDSVFANGYWAHEGQSLAYRFTLPAGTYRTFAGIREWWSENRQAALHVEKVQNPGTAQESLLSIADPVSMNTTKADQNRIFESAFTLEEPEQVEIRIEKVGGGDPILSWMSITKDPDPSGLSQILGEVEMQLHQMDPDQYSSSLRTELEEAMEQARAYMQQAQMIQKKCDQLEEKIRELYQRLLKSREPESETETESERQSESETVQEPESEPPAPKKNYKITYVLNKGKNNPGNPVYYTDPLSLLSPSRKNHIFMGWYQDPGFQKKVKKVSGQDLILYARWQKISLKKGKVTAKRNKKGVLNVEINKASKADGYEIRLSRNRRFKKGVKIYRVNKNKKTIRKLRKRTVYYLKARAYKKDSAGNTVYGKFSEVKKI